MRTSCDQKEEEVHFVHLYPFTKFSFTKANGGMSTRHGAEEIHAFSVQDQHTVLHSSSGLHHSAHKEVRRHSVYIAKNDHIARNAHNH